MALSDSCITSYNLNEGSGTTANDATGNENTGTIDGATFIAGKIGSHALRFDGVDDYLYTTTAYVNPQSYSLSLWFKTTNASGKKLIGFESNRTGTSSAYDRHIYMGTDGKIKYGWWTGAQTTISSTDTLNDGNWHHVVATLQDGVGELFIDNVSQGTANGNAYNYSGYWRIGGGTNAWTSGASGSFDGDIDDVNIFNARLNESEVGLIYNNGNGLEHPFSPPYTILRSRSVYLNNTNVSRATLQANTTSDNSNFVYALSNDGGTTFEEVNNNQIHTFTNSSGQEVQYQIWGKQLGSKINKIVVKINK